MKNLERDRRRKKGAIGSQDGSFRTFERRTRGADGRSATCILEEGWKRSDVLYGLKVEKCRFMRVACLVWDFFSEKVWECLLLVFLLLSTPERQRKNNLEYSFHHPD